MADFLESQMSVFFRRETPPENYKLLQSNKKQAALSYENGERTLQVGDTEIAIIESSTNIYLVSEKPITINVSSGTVFENMEQFAYSAKEPISITISNTQQVAVRVAYAAGTILTK